MDANGIYKKVYDIHDEVMGQLRSKKIPAYPANYKKYFDQIFLQIADQELKKAQEEAEHKVANASKDDVTRYLDIAQRSVMSFVESHSDIASVAEGQKQYLENVPENVIERCMSFIEGLQKLNENMFVELNKSQSRIDELNAELQEMIATMSIDPLTKVGNRISFIERMGLILEVGQSKKISMILLLIDVDNFKYINQEHGQQAGDNVLYYIAKTIKAMIREGDKVYRYGADQFAVILSRCDEKEAFNIAEKVRIKIEQTKLLYMGQTVFVTVSLGSTIHHQGDLFEKIMARCEEALYCAKKSGKNSTVVHDW